MNPDAVAPSCPHSEQLQVAIKTAQTLSRFEHRGETRWIIHCKTYVTSGYPERTEFELRSMNSECNFNLREAIAIAHSYQSVGTAG